MQRHHLKQLVVGVLLCLAFALGMTLQSVLPFARVTAAQGIVADGHAIRPDPAAPVAPAATTSRLTYQGRLTDRSGAPLNSAVNMAFNLYTNRTGGVPLWTSATRTITPTNGLFTVYLGGGSDPDLGFTLPMPDVAFIGVTVNGEDMTPRQPLNTVLGHSDNGIGVVGESNSGYGVYGVSSTNAGVVGQTTNVTGTGVLAFGANASGTALTIVSGGIQVLGAGVGSSTPVFTHKVITSGVGANICTSKNYASFIDNPLTNNNPKAILIITPNYGPTSTGGAGPTQTPYAVFYDDDGTCGNATGKWLIYSLTSGALSNNSLFNVLVVKP